MERMDAAVEAALETQVVEALPVAWRQFGHFVVELTPPLRRCKRDVGLRQYYEVDPVLYDFPSQSTASTMSSSEQPPPFSPASSEGHSEAEGDFPQERERIEGTESPPAGESSSTSSDEEEDKEEDEGSSDDSDSGAEEEPPPKRPRLEDAMEDSAETPLHPAFTAAVFDALRCIQQGSELALEGYHVDVPVCGLIAVYAAAPLSCFLIQRTWRVGEGLAPLSTAQRERPPPSPMGRLFYPRGDNEVHFFKVQRVDDVDALLSLVLERVGEDSKPEHSLPAEALSLRGPAQSRWRSIATSRATRCSASGRGWTC